MQRVAPQAGLSDGDDEGEPMTDEEKMEVRVIIICSTMQYMRWCGATYVHLIIMLMLNENVRSPFRHPYNPDTDTLNSIFTNLSGPPRPPRDLRRFESLFHLGHLLRHRHLAPGEWTEGQRDRETERQSDRGTQGPRDADDMHYIILTWIVFAFCFAMCAVCAVFTCVVYTHSTFTLFAVPGGPRLLWLYVIGANVHRLCRAVHMGGG